jgi:uncharacterized protein (TIGR03000 family)
MAALTVGAEAPERHGCHGGGHGCHGCYSCGGCYGGCYGGYGGCCGCYGGYGCYGGGCYGGGCFGGYVTPVVGTPGGTGPMTTPPGGGTPGGTPPGGGKEVSAPATIKVNLPENAKLFVDGVATKSTSTNRLLVTPNLPTSKQYTYNLKAQAVVDGQTVEQQQTVTVQGGQQTPVTFTFNASSVATSKD